MIEQERNRTEVLFHSIQSSSKLSLDRRGAAIYKRKFYRSNSKIQENYAMAVILSLCLFHYGVIDEF